MHSNKSAENFPTCASRNRRVSFWHLWRADRRGATAIEYAMIAAAICLGIIGIVFTIGNDVFANMFQRLADLISEHTS